MEDFLIEWAVSRYIDTLSIYKHFPKGVDVPYRLLELLEWLNTNINDEAGWFPEFAGDSLDWYCSPIDLSPYFGTFSCLGDGSLLAYWFYEGCDTQNPPIVIVGSEGDLGIVSRSIEEFVARLLRRHFPTSDMAWATCLLNFYMYPDHSWLEKLEAWAAQHWNLTPQRVQELISSFPGENHPNLEEWMDNKLQEEEKGGHKY